MITPLNTDKIRRNDLVKKEIALLGQKNGLVYFRTDGGVNEGIFYSCELESFPNHFNFKGNIEDIHEIGPEEWETIRKLVKRL